MLNLYQHISGNTNYDIIMYKLIRFQSHCFFTQSFLSFKLASSLELYVYCLCDLDLELTTFVLKPDLDL